MDTEGRCFLSKNKLVNLFVAVGKLFLSIVFANFAKTKTPSSFRNCEKLERNYLIRAGPLQQKTGHSNCKRKKVSKSLVFPREDNLSVSHLALLQIHSRSMNSCCECRYKVLHLMLKNID